LATVLAAELDRALRGLRVGQAAARRAFREYAVAVDVVIIRLAAEILRRDLFQLLQGIHRRDIVGACHRERGVAAELTDVPWKILAGVTSHDLALVPVELEHFGRNSRGAGMRER